MISAESKPVSNDRFFKLQPIEGKKALNTLGVADPRLFKDGEDANRVRAMMDPETCFWFIRYEKGAPPEALRCAFTGYGALKKYADNYFFHRNVELVEV